MSGRKLHITRIERPRVTIHCCTTPDEGERVNAQIIETKHKLVIVDAMLMRPHARELRQYAESLKKPIDRVYVTHAHPDHWFGIEVFQDKPVYALPETIEEIKFFAPIAIGFHRGHHGDEVIDKMLLPNSVANAGETVVVDGVKIHLIKIVQAEDVTMLAIDLPDQKVLLAQDLVYNKVHMFVGQRSPDGTMCFDGWIRALEDFKKRGYEVVIPGHGVPTDASVFDDNINYLLRVKKIVETSTGDNFVQRTAEAFPDYGLKSMTDMSNYFLFQMK